MMHELAQRVLEGRGLVAVNEAGQGFKAAGYVGQQADDGLADAAREEG